MNKEDIKREALMFVNEAMCLGYDFDNDVVIAYMQSGPGDDYIQYDVCMKFANGELGFVKDMFKMHEARFEYEYPITFSINQVDMEIYILGLIIKDKCEKIMSSREYWETYDPDDKVIIERFY